MTETLEKSQKTQEKPQILIVEDEGLVAYDIKQYLERSGYGVVSTVSSGEEAIEVTRKSQVDLVLMDIHIEGSLGGIGAANFMKSLFNVPVVYLTAYSDRGTIQKAKITEPYGYVVKPFNERSLISNIEIALHKHRKDKQYKEDQEWYYTAVKTMDEGLVFIDKVGVVTFINQKALAFTGWKEETVLGHPLHKSLTSKSRVPFETAVDKVLTEGISVCLIKQIVLKRMNGEETLIDLNISPVKLKGGEINGAVIVIHNISDYQKSLTAKNELINSLRDALKSKGDFLKLINLCPFCKNRQDEHKEWHKIEFFFQEVLTIDVEHEICPTCLKDMLGKVIKLMGDDSRNN